MLDPAEWASHVSHWAAGSARRVSKSLGCFSSMEEAALARDIAVIWKQLGVGASPHAASEKLNAPIGR